MEQSLLADGGAVGGIGKNYNIFTGLDGLCQIEYREVQRPAEADKELHCPVQMSGAEVPCRQSLQERIIQKLLGFWG